MEYTIDIIDTLDDSHTLLLRHAEKSSVKLSWQGGDDRAKQNIVGSALSFAMEVPIQDMADAVYSDLFTGNENRFRVRFYATVSEITIWTGFLLPDSYREPYENGTVYLQFTATDGLGRLRDKYLPADYYEKEYPVIEFLAQCLLQTGLELPIALAPAIENSSVKEYHNLFLYGAHFIDDGKSMDCYAILEMILSSMICELYQADDRWYVEGFNKKHRETVKYETYDAQGAFVAIADIQKLVKLFDGLDTPLITALPPASKAVVTETRAPIMLPEDLAQEVNEGWSIGQGVDGQIFPTYWIANGGYLPEAPAPDYTVALRTTHTLEFDDARFISLKEKLYVSRFQKMVFRGKFSAEVDPIKEGDPTENGIRIEFLLNGNTLYNVERSFAEKSLEVKFDLFPHETGNLDMRLYQPYFGGTFEDKTYSLFIFIEELTLETVRFEEEKRTEVEVDPGFTVPKELELYLSDDPAGFTKGFRLQKLKERSDDYDPIQVEVLHYFTQDGNHYSQFSLYDANLIADNIENVHIGVVALQNLEAIYNYQDGDQMVVKTDTAYPKGTMLTVRRYRVADGPENREEWSRWTDSEYPVSRLPYARIAADVLSRIFSNPTERVDYLCNNAIKYNDVIEFDYVLPRKYYPTNLTWNVDRGETEISMHRCQYANDAADTETENLIPIVNAGDDVILPESLYDPGAFTKDKFYKHTTAFAFDPDGFIASHKWTVIAGQQVFLAQMPDLGVSFYRPDSTAVPLTLQLEVTDDRGATASDTVTFRRQSHYNIQLIGTANDNIAKNRDLNAADHTRFIAYDFNTVPRMAENETITVRGNFFQELRTKNQREYDAWRLTNVIGIYKNGLRVMQSVYTDRGTKTGDFEFNFIKGDEVSFQTTLASNSVQNIFVDVDAPYQMKAIMEINEVQFQSGGGVVTGYPINMTTQSAPYG